MMKPFFQSDKIDIYHDDFLQTTAVEQDSIDLTVTSPPYNVEIAYGGYDDGIPYERYLEFSDRYLTKCLNLSKDDGRLCLNIPLDKNRGGSRASTRT